MLRDLNVQSRAQNQFWRLLGAVIGAEIRVLDYADRLEALLSHRIGLWDVVAEARRDGSLDGNIRDHAPNDLAALAETLPDLQAIGFNGGTAARIGARQLGGIGKLPELIPLPSSSPAHTRPFAEKLEDWLKLRTYL
jgi:hypoxanthine-DNA glycosylase